MISKSGYSILSRERTDSTTVSASLYAGAIRLMGGAPPEVIRSVRSNDLRRSA
ncbi:hypothetical protein D3C83_191310 [compost metagenome]